MRPQGFPLEVNNHCTTSSPCMYYVSADRQRLVCVTKTVLKFRIILTSSGVEAGDVDSTGSAVLAFCLTGRVDEVARAEPVASCMDC